MQIIENWTDVEGKVEEVEPSDVSDNFVKLRVAVNRTKPVEGFANLLDDAKGQTLAVEVPKKAAEHLQPGEKVSCRLRRAGNQKIFAHPEQVAKVKS
jgi:hypothetical protein